VPVERGAHLRMPVGGVIVEDDVDDLAGRHLGLHRVQEADEFLMPMALHVAADMMFLFGY
jgi:cobyrinic acid a,c-diamide synthase